MYKFRSTRNAVIGVAIALLTTSATFANETNVADGDALLITSGHPDDPIYANAGDNLRTGVGSIFVQFASTGNSGFLCTMSVIDNRHILTAAHCLRNTTPAGDPDPLTSIIVVLPSGVGPYILFSASGFAVHPLYDAFHPFVGAFAPGDIAVIEMAVDIPGDVERYELYRNDDEFFAETRHYGHGRSGTGHKGATGGSDFFYARTGLNMYEQTLIPFFGSALFDQLLHDYDSGGSKHNAMEWWFTSSFACHPENPNNPPQAQDGQCTTFKDGSYPDFKGFGKLEVGVAPGDSGGPGFVDGKIAGVHSFGFTHFCTGAGGPTNGTDFSCGLNSSYGEMSGDTRVSTYAGWVDDVVADVISVTSIPELPPLATAGQSGGQSVSLSDRGKSFVGSSMARTLRSAMTLDELKSRLGIE